MAERRMFAKTIVDSDAFLEMPLSTQALYFHLGMRADDEGFVNNPKRICRTVGAAEDDLRVLIAKNFVIAFESGVVVIKHWKIHNYIRADRIVSTKYREERALLCLKDNGSYTLSATCQPLVSQMSVRCQSSDGHVSDGCQSDVSIGKDSIDKNSIGKLSIDKNSKEKNKERDNSKVTYTADFLSFGPYKNVRLTESQMQSLREAYPDICDEVIGELSDFLRGEAQEYPDHYSLILKWCEEDSG